MDKTKPYSSYKRWNTKGLNQLNQNFTSLQKTLAEWLNTSSDYKDEVRKMADFKSSDDIESVQSLGGDLNSDCPDLPFFILERLTPFFELGFWVHRNMEWFIPAFFWRGQLFAMTENEVLPASDLVPPQISPLEVKITSAHRILKASGLDFIHPDHDSRAYLFKPTPECAFVLISSIPKPWAEKKMTHVMHLINAAFSK